jgi:hypothetical protein
VRALWAVPRSGLQSDVKSMQLGQLKTTQYVLMNA